jgi:hypothetical protein
MLSLSGSGCCIEPQHTVAAAGVQTVTAHAVACGMQQEYTQCSPPVTGGLPACRPSPCDSVTRGPVGVSGLGCNNSSCATEGWFRSGFYLAWHEPCVLSARRVGRQCRVQGVTPWKVVCWELWVLMSFAVCVPWQQHFVETFVWPCLVAVWYAVHHTCATVRVQYSCGAEAGS